MAFGNLVLAQWMPNVPIETRSLYEIYGAAQAEQCDVLNIAAGGDGKMLSQKRKSQRLT